MNMQSVRTLNAAEMIRGNSTLRAFEVSVFNQDVRACLKDNEDHPIYSERWCETQHAILLVRNEIDLAQKVAALFPVGLGFVIENIVERHRPDVA